MDRTTQRMFAGASVTPSGQAAYTAPGSYSLVVPAGVFSMSAVTIGGGGGGSSNTSDGLQAGQAGAGGGLRYAVSLAVTPGETLTINVGVGGLGSDYTVSRYDGLAGGTTSILRGATTLLTATGGAPGLFMGGSAVAGGAGTTIDGVNIGGGNGGNSPARSAGTFYPSGGGGAGGYSGNGGVGADSTSGTATAGAAGIGGAAGGGGASSASYGGGGVGIYGAGTSGAASTTSGKGGSGGADAASGIGGLYGGGGAGANRQQGIYNGGEAGGSGAARIIWGAGRAYPSTLTMDV